MARARTPRRSYESPRRRDQARATRSAVLEAARDLFVRNGYVATTIETIAVAASVSPETVYAIFKSKRSLLSALIDVSFAGDDEPVPILQRAWVTQLRDERDPARQRRILAKNGRLMLERSTAIYEVLQGAAAADPHLAALWERTKQQRYAGQRELLRLLTARAALRDGLTRAAASDILFTIASPETFRLLTVDRGWSPHRFERWYADTLARLLFAPAEDPR